MKTAFIQILNHQSDVKKNENFVLTTFTLGFHGQIAKKNMYFS